MMYRIIMFALLCFGAFRATAQSSTQYNQTDSQGRRTGQWIEKFPARMGEDAYAEWGTYNQGRKTGPWYRFDGEARVTSIENFNRGVRNGEAKYFENGSLYATGNFRGLNPDQELDTIWVLDPVKDIEIQRVIKTDRGSVRDGIWRYYDPRTGRMTREVEYILDEVVEKKEFAIAPVDSAWYRKREAAMPHNQKQQYRLPRGRNGFSLTK